MRRLLHLYAGNRYGGIERLLVTLAQPGPIGAVYGLAFEGRLADELRAAGATVHDLGGVRFRYPWTVLRARRRLQRLLREASYDAVVCHAPWSHALLASTVRRAGLPLIYWSHGAWQADGRLERRAARTPPDLVVANSAFNRSTVSAGFPGTPVEVIYSPVPPPPPIPAEERRALRGPDDAATVILCASRLEPLKGHPLLLDALSRLRAPGWVCWIAGGPQTDDERAYLRRLQAQAAPFGDRVRFLGERRDVPALMAAADLFVQANAAPDSFGISFIEALWAGRPVVTTDLGAAREIVDDSSGVIVPPSDAPALAAALERLIADPAARPTGGPARAAQLCDPSRQLARLAAAVDTLLDGRAARRGAA